MNLLSAEWLKLRSVRSTQILMGVAIALVGLAALLTVLRLRAWENLPAESRSADGGGTTEATILQFVLLLGGILGVLAVTSEFATGLIRNSLAAVPSRLRFLGAKIATVALAAAGIAVVTQFTTYVISELIVGDRMPAYVPGFGEQLPILLGMCASVVAIALTGLGLGTLLRSTTGAMVIIVVLVFVLYIVSNLLPSPWNNWVYSVLPMTLPQELAGVEPDIRMGPTGEAAHHVLSPWGAAAVLLAYPVLSLGAAALRFRRKDIS